MWVISNSDSQLGAIFSPRWPLAMSEESSGCHNWECQRPLEGMARGAAKHPTIPRTHHNCVWGSPTTIIWPQMPTILRLRNFDQNFKKCQEAESALWFMHRCWEKESVSTSWPRYLLQQLTLHKAARQKWGRPRTWGKGVWCLSEPPCSTLKFLSLFLPYLTE